MKSEHELCIRFGAYLRQLRHSKQLTGQELAQKLRMSQQQVSRYERGVTTPNLAIMNKIVCFFDLAWDELIYHVIHAESEK